MTKKLTNVHPFPARMAPDISVFESIDLPVGAKILDPMVGSGTVPKIVSKMGYTAIGFDLDPLAVLMSKVWNTPINKLEIAEVGKELINKVKSMETPSLPWVDESPATEKYIDFWFGHSQKEDLKKIAFCVNSLNEEVANVLKIALSRIIITKDNGASLARDVSHSRPHRVKTSSDYNVIENFQKSLKNLLLKLDDKKDCECSVSIYSGDARKLYQIDNNDIDMIITSPPYFNAIDYLRGHKLALVWMGHKIEDIRKIRSASIGAEVGLYERIEENKKICERITDLDNISKRYNVILNRYVEDINKLFGEVHRVLKVGGSATFVVANSSLKGVEIKTDELLAICAENYNMCTRSTYYRDIPNNRRYLPPPALTDSVLGNRMKRETVLTFTK